MSVDSKQSDGKPSREARFSTALWKLDKDWKEQADPPPPKPRPGRMLISVFVAIILYALSSGPVGCVLKSVTGGKPGKTLVQTYRIVYSPIVYLCEHETPLREPVRTYIQLWRAN
jgi:hypothetical protein